MLNRSWVLVMLAAWLVALRGASAAPSPPADSVSSDRAAAGRPAGWLHRLWDRADTLAAGPRFAARGTVTAGGVRGLVAPPAAVDSAARAAAEEEWLKTVWGQIDTLVQQVDFPVQTTVTAGGVRGREAEDAVSRYYYYRGGRCYPNEERVDQVIAALNAQLARRPGKADAARMHYLAGLCCDILGRRALAIDHYQRVIEGYRKSPLAPRARQRLDQLQGAAAPR